MVGKTITAIAITCASLLACATADIEGTPIAGKRSDATQTKSTNTCAGLDVELAPEEPGKFPKCACAAGGAARCVPKDKVPSAVSSQLEGCTEGGAGVCVPDKLVASGGAAPRTCKSAFGEGRCMSLCVPEVAKNGALLNRGEGDVCDDDERCVPCLNPLKNNEPTGVCLIGKQADCKTTDPPAGSSAPQVQCPYTGPPVVDPATFPACGEGMRCVPQNLIPPAQAALLDTCPTGLCAPAKSIAAGGQFLPKTCAGPGGAEGRCLAASLPPIRAQKAMLQQATCDAGELCAPCFNPLDGKDTGACKTVSCDAPKDPPKTFAGCCLSQGTARAKCVPKAMVPDGQRGNLDDDDGTCQDAELCVPNEMLQPNFKGPACTGSTFLTGSYSGVCLSSCLHFSFIEKLGISRGSCQSGFKCAPCENPLTGQPTNAPGCPGT